MTINELYGAGSAAELVNVLTPGTYQANLSQYSFPNGARGFAIWVDTAVAGAAVGKAKIDFYRDHVHFSILELEPAYQQKGIYTYLCRNFCNWLETKGVRWVTADPRNAYSSWVLQLAGFVPEGNKLVYDIPGADSRRRQYVDWKAGLRAEPWWHVTLKANPPAIEPVAGLPGIDD